MKRVPTIGDIYALFELNIDTEIGIVFGKIGTHSINHELDSFCIYFFLHPDFGVVYAEYVSIWWRRHTVLLLHQNILPQQRAYLWVILF